MLARAFALTTECTFAAPVSVLWDKLVNVVAYPQWWPSVSRVVLHGEDRYLKQNSKATFYIRGFLPYTLTFSVQVTAAVSCSSLEVVVSGGLAGTGSLILKETAEKTLVSFHWNVDLTTPLLHSLSSVPLVHAIFSANHRYATKKAIRKIKLEVEHA